MWTLMHILYAKGKLNPAQQLFMASTRSAEELYDLKTDPHEINNLAADPDHQETLHKFQAILDNWAEDTRDQGAVTEDSAIGVRDYQSVQDYYEPEQKKRNLPANASPQEYLKYWQRTLFPNCSTEAEK